ncbi:MAG: bifunctional phosphoribosylaminoimidazolecarboxamide formyltransferase/IMP cyclohydrolase [bacterium]|nr:bifunctional phosphoribosylaminoimidazolecarboxamide formyltransferase/IMP cyclohydrolase [bacterium]
MKPFALVSVYYKEGVEELVHALKEAGYGILSTGGTLKYLKGKGFDVTSVEEITGFQESPGGRVKTLHPGIFGGILARRNNSEDLQFLERHNFPLIDFVVVNLYPFSEKLNLDLEALLEFIDIGGVSLIRAASKNYLWVTLVCDPSDYKWVSEKIKNGSLSIDDRKNLALKGFRKVIEYDSEIYSELSKRFEMDDVFIAGAFYKAFDLRYGENPHQEGAVFYNSTFKDTFLKRIELLWGIELSYNNILDLYSAWQVADEFKDPACAIIKHNVPCGVGIGENLEEAFWKALKSDEESAYGGIVAFNGLIDEKLASLLNDFFFEVLVAPDYEKEAIEILRKKKKRRVVRVKEGGHFPLEYRFVDRDLLVQKKDTRELKREDLKVVAGEFDESWFKDVYFGDKVVKHVKSNAIVLVKDGMTVGIGGGQTSRVEAMRIALRKAGERAKDSILISDGFFPFSDSIELAHSHGIMLVVEPGGSKRDQEVIDKAKELGINLVFTGIRRFRH